jgi:hypothetical protein
VQREQCNDGAAAALSFLFGHRKEARAKPVAAVLLGQEEPVDEQHAEIAAAIEAAEDLAGLGIGDQHCERAEIAKPGLFVIVGPETLLDHRCRARLGRVRQGDLRIIRHLPPSTALLTRMSSRP